MQKEVKGNTIGLVSLILSIVGIFLGWIPFVGWGIVLAALICGVMGLKHPYEKGKAIAGVIISSLVIIGNGNINQ